MTNIVKFCLSLFDYFTERKIIIELKGILRNKNIIVVDIGAHKGEFISSIDKNFKILKAFCFEPNSKIFEYLKKKLSKKNYISPINIGASDFIGKIDFNENIESSSSSINELNKESNYYKKKFFFLNIFNLKNVSIKIKIDVVTLKSFILRNQINAIDLLKIDTEGHEYEVLKGLGEKINIIKLIYFEHHFDDMIIKNYNLTNIHNFLIENGFTKKFKIKMKFRKAFEYIYVNNNYTYDGK